MTCATPRRCAPVPAPSLREAAKDPEWVDRWRRDLVNALPHDSHHTITVRTGVPAHTVDDMLEGRNVRLGLAVTVEALRLCPDEPARALLGRLAGTRFAVIPAPGSQPAGGVLAANAHLLGAVSEVESALGDGLADGELDEVETIRIAAALAQAQARITALLASLGVRA